VVERLLDESPVLTPEARRINVALQRSDQAVDVLVQLREQSIAIDSVTVQKPSLDEVFLALTGHDTKESEKSSDEDGSVDSTTDRPTHRDELEAVR
jgi:ABC-2 type transport system ATP-binding protein